MVSPPHLLHYLLLIQRYHRSITQLNIYTHMLYTLHQCALRPVRLLLHSIQDLSRSPKRSRSVRRIPVLRICAWIYVDEGVGEAMQRYSRDSGIGTSEEHTSAHVDYEAGSTNGARYRKTTEYVVMRPLYLQQAVASSPLQTAITKDVESSRASSSSKSPVNAEDKSDELRVGQIESNMTPPAVSGVSRASLTKDTPPLTAHLTTAHSSLQPPNSFLMGIGKRGNQDRCQLASSGCPLLPPPLRCPFPSSTFSTAAYHHVNPRPSLRQPSSPYHVNPRPLIISILASSSLYSPFPLNPNPVLSEPQSLLPRHLVPLKQRCVKDNEDHHVEDTHKDAAGGRPAPQLGKAPLASTVVALPSSGKGLICLVCWSGFSAMCGVEGSGSRQSPPQSWYLVWSKL
ncbi:hypothetical protein EV360DRAFT_78046 [Lentinula raphanica]|nr:hypothetical protein EV360DRAFT_78046 [Lentinula raphanica]